MRLSIYTICSVFFIVACNNKPKQHAPTDKPYHLGLYLVGTDTIRYNYTITNQTQTALEANGKKINTINKTTVGLLYAMIKDSSGNIQLTITYNSLQVYSKNNDIEKEMDAANAPNTIDPVERLLGAIIGAKMYITLSPKGKILAIKGNEELKNKLLQSMNFKDAYTQQSIQQQMSQVLGSDFITANLEQTISVLPDSTVYIGDTWQTNSKQSGQIPLALSSTYTLNAIDNNIAKLSLESTVQSDSSTNKIMGYNVASSLQGKQKGYFEIDQTTGLVINSTSTTAVEGSIQLMGRDIPITIKSEKKLTGRKF